MTKVKKARDLAIIAMKTNTIELHWQSNFKSRRLQRFQTSIRFRTWVYTITLKLFTVCFLHPSPVGWIGVHFVSKTFESTTIQARSNSRHALFTASAPSRHWHHVPQLHHQIFLFPKFVAHLVESNFAGVQIRRSIPSLVLVGR